jgi:hypothetical protein
VYGYRGQKPRGGDPEPRSWVDRLRTCDLHLNNTTFLALASTTVLTTVSAATRDLAHLVKLFDGLEPRRTPFGPSWHDRAKAAHLGSGSIAPSRLVSARPEPEQESGVAECISFDGAGTRGGAMARTTRRSLFVTRADHGCR